MRDMLEESQESFKRGWRKGFEAGQKQAQTNTQQVHKIAASPHQLPSLRAGVIGRINGNVPAPERELAAYKICLLY